MQLSLFFIPLLVTISGLPIALNPKKLVATSLNVDPDAIETLKQYVNQLITEGEDEKTRLAGVRDDAQAVLDTEIADLAVAVDNLENAKNVHTAKVGVQSEKNADELAKRAIREEKLGIKNEKKSILDGAKSFEASEQVRLDNEKSLFEKVKSLLVGVAADRRLLNADALSRALALLKATLMQKTNSFSNQALALLQITDNADPDQVKEALDLLDDLIDAGEQERADAVAALKQAQSEFDTASGIHADAVGVHTLAEGALEDANIEMRDAKAVLTLRTQEHKDATQDKSDASDDLDDKQQNLDDQTAKIESEKLDLEMIHDLLDRLE